MLALFLAAAATATTATALPPANPSPRPPVVRTKNGRIVGQETTIPFADTDSLSSWTPGPSSDSVYVEDLTGNWYLVKMAGPCMQDNIGIHLAYSTDVTGSFGPFSKIYSTEPPHMTCPVISVTNALSPSTRRKDARNKG